MTKTYVALIADTVASRALLPKARARLQSDLQAALPLLNRRWRAHLAARFAVTLGDELQALFLPGAPLWDITHLLRARFADVHWVIACGRGPISTPLAPTAPEVDGPCFHQARRALNDAKQRRLVYAFGGFDPRVEGCAAYYSALYWGWTAKQRQAALWWRCAPGRGPFQVDLGRRVERMQPSAVSHMRRRMAWPLVERGDRMFRDLLEVRAP
ncbi:MAG TPA: SatD family protein [Gemmatimonadales bacterium]|nr:SatD family protein [Gemmatimonadales bacterium]